MSGPVVARGVPWKKLFVSNVLATRLVGSLCRTIKPCRAILAEVRARKKARPKGTRLSSEGRLPQMQMACSGAKPLKFTAEYEVV